MHEKQKKLDTQTTLHDIKVLVKKLIDDRDWNQFHDAKNLSMDIAIEAGELMEHFVWTDSKDVQQVFEKNREEIEHEVADILLVTMSFCNQYNIDINTIVTKKLELIAQKYPIEKAKGKSTKYTKL
jgi:dCTP diphosphatase